MIPLSGPSHEMMSYLLYRLVEVWSQVKPVAHLVWGDSVDFHWYQLKKKYDFCLLENFAIWNFNL